MTYPLSWSVIPHTVVRKERWPGGYKASCVPLVQAGQDVLPDQPVLRVERKAKAVEAVQTLPLLTLPSVTSGISLKAIQTELDAATREIEVVPAGLRGRVIRVTPRGGVVIESQVAVVQGAIGAGNQVAGILTMWQPPNANRAPQPIPPGAILAVPGPVNFMMLRQAVTSGVVGIVASSIALRDLEGFLSTDLLELLNARDSELAQAHLPPLTVFLSEGLGNVAMSVRVMNMLSRYQGSIALLSGVTSVRQHIFPELIISLPKETQAVQGASPTTSTPSLSLGAQVRICSGEREGTIGIIDYLFTHQQVFASGIRTQAVRLRLEDGSFVVVPLLHVERIG